MKNLNKTYKPKKYKNNCDKCHNYATIYDFPSLEDFDFGDRLFVVCKSCLAPLLAEGVEIVDEYKEGQWLAAPDENENEYTQYMADRFGGVV